MNAFFGRIGDYLLERTLASECRRARLVRTSVQLSFGHIEYLCSQDKPGASTEAVVMLHGAASDKTSWIRFAKHLGVAIPLVIPDLPGHGESTAQISLDYGINAQALRLTEFFIALGLKKVHLIGNSMGGAIALQLAAHSSDLVVSLVLIDAAGVEASPSWLRQRIANTGINPMIEVSDASDYRAMLDIGMASPPYIPGVILNSLARDFISRKSINRKIAGDIERDLDQTANLRKIVAPSLIIWGTEDKILHVDNAELLYRQLTGERKIVMEKVGHVPMVEAPRQTAVACTAFLNDVTRRRLKTRSSYCPPSSV